ncbi:hypothetical protein DALLNEIH_03233 [Bacillus sp. B01(2024)]
MVLLFFVQTPIIVGNDIYFDESVNSRSSIGDMREKMLSYYNEISILKTSQIISI